MTLSDINIKNAKPIEKPYKLADGNGIYLMVHPNGGKYFRLDYRFEGKRKTLALGTYANVPLKNARGKAFTAKQQITNGIDPAANKQAIKAVKAEAAANSLEVIAKEWLIKKCQDKSTRPKNLLANVLPWLGAKPIDAIIPKEILDCLRRIEAKGTIETAHRICQIISQVYRYAVATGRAGRDITVDLRGALLSPTSKHFAAITEPKAVTELLRAIEGFQGSFVVNCAQTCAFALPAPRRTTRRQMAGF